MQWSLLSFWRAYFPFSLGLLLHCGEATVHTQVQAGPLYRVVGTPLLISCNVSGFKNVDTRKEFQIRVKLPATSSPMNIISSSNQGFGYALYKKRVRDKEISLTHVSPNSINFEIHSLQKNDEGEYECSVVNEDGVYDGTYGATTIVKVIDNSLSVSSPVSTSLSYNEGDALTLTCQASSNTIQHTHLSLAWYLHKENEDNAQPIISLDRDFTLKPGKGFEGRYQEGLIMLDKVGETTYRLKMAQLELSDQGRIYCRAHEWIQDPDLSWYPITMDDAGKATLSVRAREVVLDAASLVVSLSAQQTTLQEGQELSISCHVEMQNLEEKFLSVAWLRGSVELARIGPTGVLSVGSEYRVRENEGELRALRIGDRDYRLILQPVRTADQGEYICRAWPQDRGQDGAFTQGAAQDSSFQLVSISATESGLSVEMQNTVSVNEGGRLSLTCRVYGVNGRLSITWQRKLSTSTFTNIISLSQEGVMENAMELTNRKVKAMRPAADTFVLELDEVTVTDSGVYQCAVSEWEKQIDSKTNSQSQTATVTVAPTDSFVKVNLISRNNIATMGDNVELMCRVRGLSLPITLTWILQRDASTIDNILTLYSNGPVSWSADQHRYQLKVEKTQDQIIYYLLINDVSHREAGNYQCLVSLFLENAYKKLPPSNNLALMVQNPVSSLTLTPTPALTRHINTDIDMKCSVTSAPSASSRYAVTWTLQQPTQNMTIVRSDRDSLVTYGPNLEVSYKQRISTRRTEGPSFELTVRQTRLSDKGSYLCEVIEWRQDPLGEWYQLSPVSGTTELTLIEPASDLRLDDKEQQVIAREGDEVQFECNLVSGPSSPSFFYKVTWLYAAHDSSIVNVPLVELDHTGLLRYPKNQGLQDLQGRLRLSRPSQSSFRLGIQRAHENDSGTFQCQVEQYQLDHEGHWQQKASTIAGPMTLSVNVTGSELSIVKEDVEMNVSRSQDFTIPCHITKQSSPESEFQVTWFWQERTDSEQRPIFTAYRNSTLQDRFGKGDQLRFGHSLQNQFNLKVLQPVPEDSGLYFCEVEEWLPSLSQRWRSGGVAKSGYLNVSVYAEVDGDASRKTGCTSVIGLGVLIGVVTISLFVIFLLVLKICKSKNSEKKPGQSLWTEDHPLKTKTGAED